MEKENSHHKNRSRVQSVERALLLLEIISKHDEGISLTQLAENIDLPKSTVHGLVATLRDYNFVDQDSDTGFYKLGVKLFELGTTVARNWDVRDHARPVLRRLNKEFGETVHLGAEDNSEVLYLDKVVSDSLTSIVSEIGTRLPMHCSALGKVLLAQKSKAELKRYIDQKGLPALTGRTITTVAKLEQELEKVRAQGYAVDDGEVMEGLRCIAAPIMDANGKVRYTISVSGQVRDMYGRRLENIISQTIRAAAEISYAISKNNIR